MTNATHISHLVAKGFLLTLLIFSPLTYTVMASEITGTLSSDGSSDTSNQATIMTTNNESRGLSGTVVDGINDSQSEVAAMSSYLWPSIALILALTTVYFYRKRRI